MPGALRGLTVVDLGCGAGRDAFVLSKLVGEEGRVIGIDMTSEQLEVAKRHTAYHAEKWGYARSNVTFTQGHIEDLASAGLEDDSVDLVVSNCVFNLAPDKQRLFKEVLRVLKPGGELYFSDVFVDRRLPPQVRSHSVLLGECLGGALYLEDFRRIMRGLGIHDYRILSRRPISVTNPELSQLLGNAQFESITIRVFKLQLEDQCEDYGQAVAYRGGIPDAPQSFVLDDHHEFEVGKLMPVCGNTATMVIDSRFGQYFEIFGEGNVHYGLFPCGPVDKGSSSSGEACC